MFSFTVSRKNARRPSPEKIKKQLEKMAKAALRGNRSAQGWHLVNQIIAPSPKCIGDCYEYTFTFNFERQTQRAVSHESSVTQFEKLMEMAQQAGNIHQWNVVDYNTNQVTTTNTISISFPAYNSDEDEDVEEYSVEPFYSPAIVHDGVDREFNLNPAGYFDHLYDRDAQVNVLISGARTAVDSDFTIRNHTLIEGDPAGGKTTLAKAFKDMVGEEYCHYIDATTSTQAGILLELMEVPDSVKFLIIEEVEKVKPDDLRWLLGVMDERGEINVCNAKVGVMRRKLPVYVIATVNDVNKLESFQSGAIASRFGDRIYCPALSRETIYKAIKQAVDKIGGNEAWINPAIDYCLNVEGTRDIRRIKAIALGGRDRLLTGEYQRILKATSRPR